MSCFHKPRNVEEYIKMTERYDGRGLINILKQHLPKGSTVLELGMGQGKDLDILKENYQATGSDYSQMFTDRYQKQHPEADIIKLDAVIIETERKFDCVYSNKVLHHLTREELRRSLFNQRKVLNPKALLLHTFCLT